MMGCISVAIFVCFALCGFGTYEKMKDANRKSSLKDASLQKKRFLQNVLNYENDTLNISNNSIFHSSNITGQVRGGL